MTDKRHDKYEPVLRLVRKANKAKDWRTRINAFQDAADRLAAIDAQEGPRGAA